MRVILAAILTAAIAAPAAANTYKTTDTGTVKLKKVHHGAGAYAYVPVTRLSRTQDVYVNGVYVGSDPDWRVRETLRREHDTGPD